MLRNIKFSLAVLIFIIPFISVTYAQDTTWQLSPGGWVNDVYYENLFLGGSYWTRISTADIDDDGDLDMFYGGGDCGSLVFFENVGNAQTPIFEFVYEEFPGLKHSSWLSGVADADFADLDSDGDLDAGFSSDLNRGGMIFWNDGNSINPDYTYRSPYGPLEGQSNITLVDIDNDADYDILSGHGNNDFDIFFAENIGTIYSPVFDVVTRHYQNISTWGPFNIDFGDLDQDGDYDMIMCKWGGSISYYENTGTPDSANLTLITDDLLPSRDTTDWMEAPELADIDDDGDLDLFLAGNYAHLFYFENVGFDSLPQFDLVYDTLLFYVIPLNAGTWLKNSVDIDGDGDDDIAPGASLFLNESFNGEVKYHRVDDMLPFVAGAFADVDADGDYDYLSAGGINTIGYHENVNDSTWPVWNERIDLFPPDGRLQNIYTLASGDLNNDGTIDLLIGHENSNSIDYYQNNGTPEIPDFSFNSSLALPQWEYRGYFYCILEDIDHDDDFDLFIGDSRIDHSVPVRLLFYRNDGTPSQASWTYITDDFQSVERDHRNGTIVPCFSDVDNDGDRDFLTTAHLGLMLLLNPEIQTSIQDYNTETFTTAGEDITIYCAPNPSNIILNINVESNRNTYAKIDIINILGRQVFRVYKGILLKGNNNFSWDASNHSTGIYFVKLEGAKNTYIKKFTILK